MNDLNISDEAIAAGWHEFRYPRPATDAPSVAFKRGLAAAAPLIVAAAMEKLAAQYPADEFPETADEIVRCSAAGITLDGIQALAIRERMLAEAKRLRGEQS